MNCNHTLLLNAIPNLDTSGRKLMITGNNINNAIIKFPSAKFGLYVRIYNRRIQVRV